MEKVPTSTKPHYSLCFVKICPSPNSSIVYHLSPKNNQKINKNHDRLKIHKQIYIYLAFCRQGANIMPKWKQRGGGYTFSGEILLNHPIQATLPPSASKMSPRPPKLLPNPSFGNHKANYLFSSLLDSFEYPNLAPIANDRSVSRSHATTTLTQSS